MISSITAAYVKLPLLHGKTVKITFGCLRFEMNNFWVLFLVFTIYSFLGWITESIFCSVPAGKFINRGFLTGPFCPIYGVGAVIAIPMLSQLKDTPVLLYVAGAVITSLLEYFTGFLLEKTFHTTYWDYSGHRFNIRGRVCLQNTLLFGLMCLVGVLYIHPVVMRLVGMVPGKFLPFIDILLMIYFITDFVISATASISLNGRLAELQEIMDEIKERASLATAETIESLQAKIGGLLDEDTRSYLKVRFEKKEKIESNIKFFQRRMIDAFPTMKSITSNESLQRLKAAIQDKAKNIRRG